MGKRFIKAVIISALLAEGTAVDHPMPAAQTAENGLRPKTLAASGKGYALRPRATGGTSVLKMLDMDRLPKRTEEQARGAIVSYYHSGRGLKEGDYLVTTIMPGKKKDITYKKKSAYFYFKWLKDKKKKIGVIFIAEKDINHGLVLNCCRCYHSEGNVLLYDSSPLATFKYLSRKRRDYRWGPKTGICTRISLAASDIFDYYHGRGDIKPVEDRRLRLNVYYHKNREEFVAATNRGSARGEGSIEFSLWPAANEIYKKNGRHQVAYAEIREHPDYGPYVEIFYEDKKHSKHTVISRYYDFRRLLGRRKGRCSPVDFSKLPFIDYVAGNKNVHGKEIVPLEEYYNSKRANELGRVAVEYRGRGFIIRRLTSLKGKRPVFVRKRDERYGYIFHAYDAAEYAKDKTRAPEHTLVRDLHSKTLVLIERVKVHQARELIDKGFYLSAISILEDYFKQNPDDIMARRYYKKAKRLYKKVMEVLSKPKSIRRQDGFDFYLRVLADTSTGKGDADKKEAREKALLYLRGIEPLSVGRLNKLSSGLIETLDFESGLVSQTPMNIAVLYLLFELPAGKKTLSLTNRAAGFIRYRGPFKKELESAGMRFFNSILDEGLRWQFIEEKKEEWSGLLRTALQKENVLSDGGKVKDIKALERINIGIFEDNGLMGIYNFYIGSRFIIDEKPEVLSFSHFILYKLGLVDTELLERKTGISGEKLEAVQHSSRPRPNLGIDTDIPPGHSVDSGIQASFDSQASEVLHRNNILPEPLKRIWRPRLLKVLNNKGLLDENEKIKDVDTFLSIDSNLFVKSNGKNGLLSLYQSFNNMWMSKLSRVPKGASLYHFILKEFNVVSFDSCLGYCREALERKDMAGAIKVLDIVKTLYEEELDISYEYMTAVERLENGIVQLAEELSESARLIIVHIAELYYDWKMFFESEEELLRSAREVNGFLTDSRRRIMIIKEMISKFKKIMGRETEFDAAYLGALDSFSELLRQFLRLRRVLKKANGNGYILKDDIEAALKGKRAEIKKKAKNKPMAIYGSKTDAEGSGSENSTEGKTGPKAEGQTSEDTQSPDFPDDEEDKEIEEDVPSYEPPEVEIIKQMIAKMPDTAELVEYEITLIDAEVIIEYFESPDNGQLYTLEEIQEALEELLVPGFLNMLELGSDRVRWRGAVGGLKRLLPSDAVIEHDCPLDFLNEKEKDDAFDSAA